VIDTSRGLDVGKVTQTFDGARITGKFVYDLEVSYSFIKSHVCKYPYL
jgi:hypothetical protein